LLRALHCDLVAAVALTVLAIVVKNESFGI
jgi:hypothetical protein